MSILFYNESKLFLGGPMQTPLHPIVVHFPMALAVLVPILILVFALMIKAKKMESSCWAIILGLQLLLTGTGYLALETGENEEERVEKVVARKLIQEHELASEIFVGSTVIALVLGVVALFIREELQFRLHLAVFLAGLISIYLGYRAGNLGGELVYVHGAAEAYGLTENGPAPEGILPTPGMNTSESPFPVDENESLKADEFDYGNSDELVEDDEEMKQED